MWSSLILLLFTALTSTTCSPFFRTTGLENEQRPISYEEIMKENDNLSFEEIVITVHGNPDEPNEESPNIDNNNYYKHNNIYYRQEAPINSHEENHDHGKIQSPAKYTDTPKNSDMSLEKTMVIIPNDNSFDTDKIYDTSFEKTMIIIPNDNSVDTHDMINDAPNGQMVISVSETDAQDPHDQHDDTPIASDLLLQKWIFGAMQEISNKFNGSQEITPQKIFGIDEADSNEIADCEDDNVVMDGKGEFVISWTPDLQDPPEPLPNYQTYQYNIFNIYKQK